MSFQCCYCKVTFQGKNRYEIPPDYPRNPAHAGRPLCDTCGGSSGPTLEQICDRLDAELSQPELTYPASPIPENEECGLCHKKVQSLFRTLAGRVCAVCLVTPAPRAPGCPTR